MAVWRFSNGERADCTACQCLVLVHRLALAFVPPWTCAEKKHPTLLSQQASIPPSAAELQYHTPPQITPHHFPKHRLVGENPFAPLADTPRPGAGVAVGVGVGVPGVPALAAAPLARLQKEEMVSLRRNQSLPDLSGLSFLDEILGQRPSVASDSASSLSSPLGDQRRDFFGNPLAVGSVDMGSAALMANQGFAPKYVPLHIGPLPLCALLRRCCSLLAPFIARCGCFLMRLRSFAVY